MVEASIAIALLGAAVYFGMSLTDVQGKARRDRKVQSVYRYLAIQSANVITGQSAMFPPLYFETEPAVYVSCFSNKGEPALNSTGTRDFVLTNITADDLKSHKPSIRCTRTAAGVLPTFEVRFWYGDVTDVNKVTLEILDLQALKSSAGRRIPKQRFTIYR
jgi:hypothetical protein